MSAIITKLKDSSRRAAPCRSILMVGTDLDARGGVRTVVRGLEEAGLFRRFDATYVATHRHGSRWTKLSAALRGWAKVAFLLFKLDAPLVHVQMSSRASFWRKSVVCRMARLAGRPYLLHIHCGEFLQFYASESGPFAQRYIRNVLGKAVLVIALSEQWRERLLSICPTANVEVVSNAVSLPDLAQRRLDGPPQVLYLGDIRAAKGTHDLLRALARIAGRFPALQLVYGGTGSSDEVRALASELGVADRVVLPGWLDPERKREAFAAATLFALPSYAEGMPMALMEAMAWGLPTISTPVGGIPQLITTDANGLLVQPGDIEGLAHAIERLLSDPALRARLGEAARATIRSGFTLERSLARLTQIYRRFGIEERA
jgi:glycosyltransferase involved in cell wall biosynthesis